MVAADAVAEDAEAAEDTVSEWRPQTGLLLGPWGRARQKASAGVWRGLLEGWRAERMQAAARGLLARARLRAMRVSATRLQAAARGLLGRRVDGLRAEAAEAATVQAATVGVEEEPAWLREAEERLREVAMAGAVAPVQEGRLAGAREPTGVRQLRAATREAAARVLQWAARRVLERRAALRAVRQELAQAISDEARHRHRLSWRRMVLEAAASVRWAAMVEVREACEETQAEIEALRFDTRREEAAARLARREAEVAEER